MGDDIEALLRRIEALSVPEPMSGCWLWLGTVSSGGYGRVWFNGRLQQAHRVAYEAVRGPLEPRQLACHRCDVPACVNPAHIFPGTMADNIRDMHSKKRHPWSQVTHCKLGHELVPGRKGGLKMCRICTRAQQSASQKRLWASNPEKYRAKQREIRRNRAARSALAEEGTP